MKALDLLSRAETLGVALLADGSDIVVRFEDLPPADFVEALRQYKPEVLDLLRHGSYGSASCRGCAANIPAGTTLCTGCGSASSPLVRFALEFSAFAKDHTLQGQALDALDRLNYPRLQLRNGQEVGPGLIDWCHVLGTAETDQLTEIIKLAEACEGNDVK